MTASWEAATDVLVVGSGVAGLTTATDAAAAGRKVLILTKGAADEANTYWAQGGVAVVREERDPGDSIGAHVEDTLIAGAGLSDPAAVAMIIGAGPGAVQRLIDRGAHFDCGPTGLLRTREGGHSADRVIHAGGDATGAEIQRAMLAAPGLPAMLTGHQVLDVLKDRTGRAVGVSVLDAAGRIGVIRAGAVVLATGGASQLYAASTNPAVATGDGLAMGLRVGATLADLEFIQFHPTMLWTGPAARGQGPLVTEAVRAEGAVLIDATGARVMTGVHPLEDLAPRDVVSLAITRRLALAPGGITDHVFLDATGIDPAVFARRFPTVSRACREAGIDPTTMPIPVSPAAHFSCGGVLTDLSGRTSIPGLYAVGEVARTGLHGANRLASNSLLEGLVMGERAAQAIVIAEVGPGGEPDLPTVATAPVEGRAGLQTAMSTSAGIGRDADGLDAVRHRAWAALGRPAPVSRESVETAGLALVSAAVTSAAAVRQESRGCHVRTDFPDRTSDGERSVVLRLADGELQTEVADLRRRAIPLGGRR